MNFKLTKAIKIVDTLTAASIIIGVITINATYEKLGLQGYSFESVSLSVYTTIISMTAALITFSTILYYTWRTLEIVGEEEKPRILIFMKLTAYITALSLFILIGLIYFTQTKNSLATIKIAGITFYPYPIALFTNSIIMTGIAVYLYLFYLSQTRELEKTNTYALITLFIILISLHLPPNNNYGLGTQKILPDIRPISDGLTALFIIITLILYIKKLLEKLRQTTENTIKGRIKALVLGNALLLLTVILETLDILSGTPYSIWLTLSAITLILAVILYYIGTLMPNWATKYLTK